MGSGEEREREEARGKEMAEGIMEESKRGRGSVNE